MVDELEVDTVVADGEIEPAPAPAPPSAPPVTAVGIARGADGAIGALRFGGGGMSITT
jgi:hypothetical protein